MKWQILFSLQVGALLGYSQCALKTEVQPNGTIHKVTERELFYSYKATSLYGACVHDGRNYYFDLVIKPIPAEKIKETRLLITMDGGKKGELKFYDTRVNKRDSTVDVLFDIDEKTFDLLTHRKIRTLTIWDAKGQRNYNLINHPGLLRQQLTCLQKSLKK